MAYSDPVNTHNPTTGVAIPTAWGDAVNDAASWLSGSAANPKPSCRVYKSSAQSITTGTNTAITFDSERFDNGGMHSTSVNTSRITIPTGGGGIYLIGGAISWAANATGVRYVSVYLNGTTHLGISEDTSVTATDHYMTVSTLYALSAGDYVELVVQQSSGGNLNIQSVSAYSPEFWAIWQAV